MRATASRSDQRHNLRVIYAHLGSSHSRWPLKLEDVNVIAGVRRVPAGRGTGQNARFAASRHHSVISVSFETRGVSTLGSGVRPDSNLLAGRWGSNR
jgi:hypothetical protein